MHKRRLCPLVGDTVGFINSPFQYAFSLPSFSLKAKTQNIISCQETNMNNFWENLDFWMQGKTKWAAWSSPLSPYLVCILDVWSHTRHLISWKQKPVHKPVWIKARKKSLTILQGCLPLNCLSYEKSKFLFVSATVSSVSCYLLLNAFPIDTTSWYNFHLPLPIMI